MKIICYYYLLDMHLQHWRFEGTDKLKA